MHLRRSALCFSSGGGGLWESNLGPSYLVTCGRRLCCLHPLSPTGEMVLMKEGAASALCGVRALSLCTSDKGHGNRQTEDSEVGTPGRSASRPRP